MTVPYTFGTATTSIPLSNLDANFNTPITLGNTSIYLGNTTTTIGNLTLTNVTISSGTANITSNITYATANAVVFTNSSSIGTTGANLTFDGTTFTANSIKNSALTSGRVTYAGASGLLSDSANLVWDNTNARLGIGTSSPSYPLSVAKAGNSSIVLAQLRNSDAGSSAATSFAFGNDTSAEAARIVYGSSTNSTIPNTLFITNDLAGSIILRTDGTERMRITSAGDVGIGTSSPSAILHTSISGSGEVGRFATTTDNTPYISIYSNGSIRAKLRASSAETGLLSQGATPLLFGTNDTERMQIDSSGNVGINTTTISSGSGADRFLVIAGSASAAVPALIFAPNLGNKHEISSYNGLFRIFNSSTAQMTLDNSGNLLVGKTVNDTTTNGCNISAAGRGSFSSNGQAVGDYNRTGDDGTLVNFLQDGTIEGTISVSGTTVSYNGGHLSRWSQWQNQSGQPNVYRGTVLDSTNDMCQWNQANEQSTKTIVSNTEKTKTVAGVFDRYDFDDKVNPNDFYVAQSGDFVIRIAQGVVVQNGDLLESAGDGTARPQTDDICRSSTIAKVTSNYVSTTYADGSFCVPCILMIG